MASPKWRLPSLAAVQQRLRPSSRVKLLDLSDDLLARIFAFLYPRKTSLYVTDRPSDRFGVAVMHYALAITCPRLLRIFRERNVEALSLSMGTTLRGFDDYRGTIMRPRGEVAKMEDLNDGLPRGLRMPSGLRYRSVQMGAEYYRDFSRFLARFPALEAIELLLFLGEGPMCSPEASGESGGAFVPAATKVEFVDLWFGKTPVFPRGSRGVCFLDGLRGMPALFPGLKVLKLRDMVLQEEEELQFINLLRFWKGTLVELSCSGTMGNHDIQSEGGFFVEDMSMFSELHEMTALKSLSFFALSFDLACLKKLPPNLLVMEAIGDSLVSSGRPFELSPAPELPDLHSLTLSCLLLDSDVERGLEISVPDSVEVLTLIGRGDLYMSVDCHHVPFMRALPNLRILCVVRGFLHWDSLLSCCPNLEQLHVRGDRTVDGSEFLRLPDSLTKSVWRLEKLKTLSLEQLRGVGEETVWAAVTQMPCLEHLSVFRCDGLRARNVSSICKRLRVSLPEAPLSDPGLYPPSALESVSLSFYCNDEDRRCDVSSESDIYFPKNQALTQELHGALKRYKGDMSPLSEVYCHCCTHDDDEW